MKNISSPKVAIIGLGSMGLGMAQSIAKSGMAVSGFDLNPLAVRALAENGGTAASSAKEAAKGTDILPVVVVNAAQTRDVLFAEDGVASPMKPSEVIISCATISPAMRSIWQPKQNRLGYSIVMRRQGWMAMKILRLPA